MEKFDGDRVEELVAVKGHQVIIPVKGLTAISFTVHKKHQSIFLHYGRDECKSYYYTSMNQAEQDYDLAKGYLK